MTDETAHIACAAALLDDPYAALNQHLHGDHGDEDKCDSTGCSGKAVVRLSYVHLCDDCYSKLEMSA